jgi:hypothetical protein
VDGAMVTRAIVIADGVSQATVATRR